MHLRIKRDAAEIQSYCIWVVKFGLVYRTEIGSLQDFKIIQLSAGSIPTLPSYEYQKLLRPNHAKGKAEWY